MNSQHRMHYENEIIFMRCILGYFESFFEDTEDNGHCNGILVYW